MLRSVKFAGWWDLLVLRLIDQTDSASGKKRHSDGHWQTDESTTTTTATTGHTLTRWHSISGRPYARPREHLGTRDTHTHKKQTRANQQRECQLEQRPDRREEARRGTDKKCVKPHSTTGRTTACSGRWRLSAAPSVAAHRQRG